MIYSTPSGVGDKNRPEPVPIAPGLHPGLFILKPLGLLEAFENLEKFYPIKLKQFHVRPLDNFWHGVWYKKNIIEKTILSMAFLFH